MREKLRAYVLGLFRDAANTPQNEELREEILQNTLDRYDDLISRGISEEQAYAQAVASIGSVEHLLEKRAAAPRKRRIWPWILGGCTILAVLLLVGWIALWRSLPPHYRGDDPGDLFDYFEDRVEHAAEGVERAVENAVGNAVGSAAEHSVSIPVTDRYENAGSYTEGGTELPQADVRELDISWVSGQVRVEQYAGDTVLVSETKSETAPAMRWWLEEGTLHIHPMESGAAELEAKRLLIQLPQSMELERLRLDVTSAEMEVLEISVGRLVCASVSGSLRYTGTAGALEFDSTSGSLDAEAVCGSLDADTASGNVIFRGMAGGVELDTVSGSGYLSFTETPAELSFSSASGDLQLTIPGERSFEADMETVSGSLSSELAFSKQGDSMRYQADGIPAELDFETVSGDVEILRGT